MLSALFGSTLRAKILSTLLLHPEKKYNLQELAVNLNLSVNLTRRELENLTAMGIVKEEEIKEEKTKIEKIKAKNKNRTLKKPTKKSSLYNANENFLLFSEIKSLFVKAQILSSQKLLENLQKTGQAKFLALTGSFTNYPEAQTDILIVGKIKRSSFLDSINELEKDLGREINFTILSEREFDYRRQIMDIFLYNILEGKTIVILDNLGKKQSSPQNIENE
ncbi:MAG: hypothetical protein WC146_01135 [Patescibacteria group bacterium]|jgi:predicted transcriptional regulator